MISDEKIREIVDKTDIVSLVGEYVELKKKGKNYFGLCPFHDDENPSFSVSPEKKIAKCMSCGEGGNPINFLRKIKNISFDQAAKELAIKYNVTLDEVDLKSEDNSFNRYYKINELATNFYENYLFNSKSGIVALEYLEKRGLSKETIKKFRIGLAPKEDDLLFQYLTNNNYQAIELEDIGLTKNEKDIFKDRIMFPIIDDKNHILAFSGRIYYPSDTEAKYINTTETAIYKKGEALYNLNNAISEIRKKKYFFLCEGQMDVISMYNNGFKNVVCSLGTALTNEQVALLKKYSNQVIILYDGDNAGVKATKKAFNLFKDFKAFSVTLPNGMDPDEYLKKYKNSDLEQYIKDNSLDIYEFNYRCAFKDRNIENVYDFEEIKKDVFNLLRDIKQSTIVEKYLLKLSADLHVSNDSLLNEFNINRFKKIEKEIPPIEKKAILNHEFDFLCLSIYKKDYFQEFKMRLSDPTEYITSDLALDIYNIINYYYEQESEDAGKLLKYVRENCHDDKVNDIFDRINELSSESDEVSRKRINDLIKRFEDKKYILELKSFKIPAHDVANNMQQDILAKKLKMAITRNKGRK